MTYTTGNARAVIKGCGWDELAEKENLILISPEYNNYATYSETDRLMRDVEYAIQKYPVDISRIYSTGFSNGGAASVAMVSRYPNAFAAISAMGWMIDMQGEDNSYDIPFQVIQGTEEYTQKINGFPAIMDDERDAVHSLLLYNEMIHENIAEDYQKTPYWGYRPDKIITDEQNGEKITVNNYFKTGYAAPFAQFILIDGAKHEMHIWEAGAAWNFFERFSRTQNRISENNGAKFAETDDDTILALYQSMENAMVNKDITYLRKIMPDHVTHITGRVQTIDEWLDDVESERMKYYSVEVTEPDIKIENETALLTCTNVIHARIYGSEGIWSLPGSAWFTKDENGWHFDRKEINK